MFPMSKKLCKLNNLSGVLQRHGGKNSGASMLNINNAALKIIGSPLLIKINLIYQT